MTDREILNELLERSKRRLAVIQMSCATAKEATIKSKYLMEKDREQEIIAFLEDLLRQQDQLDGMRGE